MMSNPVFPIAIDNTMRAGLVKCQTLAHYEFEMGLQSPEPNVDLHAGIAFAKGMEMVRKAYYLHGASPQEAFVEGVAALHDAYGNFACPAGSNKSADRMAGALAYYLDRKPLQEEDLVPLNLGDMLGLGIEMSFNYPIGIMHPYTGKELTYCGRYDLLAKHIRTGKVWVVDEKTTKTLGEKWGNQWALDGGLTGYVWGAKRLIAELGLDFEVEGAIINGISIKLRDYDYMACETHRQSWQIVKWLDQLLKDVEGWKHAYLNQDHNQILGHSCALYNNPCKFDKLCLSRNPERLIEGSYVVRFWNPLKRG